MHGDLNKSFMVPQEREEGRFPPITAVTLHSQGTYSERDSDHREGSPAPVLTALKAENKTSFGWDPGLPHC